MARGRARRISGSIDRPVRPRLRQGRSSGYRLPASRRRPNGRRGCPSLRARSPWTNARRGARGWAPRIGADLPGISARRSASSVSSRGNQRPDASGPCESGEGVEAWSDAVRGDRGPSADELLPTAPYGAEGGRLVGRGPGGAQPAPPAPDGSAASARRAAPRPDAWYVGRRKRPGHEAPADAQPRGRCRDGRPSARLPTRAWASFTELALFAVL
jgi:hypothetical protein